MVPGRGCFLSLRDPAENGRAARDQPAEKRGELTDCASIAGHPNVINRRCRYGDWEGDTLVGKSRRSALAAIVERKSG